MNLLAPELATLTQQAGHGKKAKAKTHGGGSNLFAALLDHAATDKAKSAEHKKISPNHPSQKTNDQLELTKAILDRTTASLSEKNAGAKFKLKDEGLREGRSLASRMEQLRKPENPYLRPHLIWSKQLTKAEVEVEEETAAKDKKKGNQGLDTLLNLLAIQTEKGPDKIKLVKVGAETHAIKTKGEPPTGTDQTNPSNLISMASAGKGHGKSKAFSFDQSVAKDPLALVGEGRKPAAMADLQSRALGSPAYSTINESAFGKIRKRGDDGHAIKFKGLEHQQTTKEAPAAGLEAMPTARPESKEPKRPMTNPAAEPVSRHKDQGPGNPLAEAISTKVSFQFTEVVGRKQSAETLARKDQTEIEGTIEPTTSKKATRTDQKENALGVALQKAAILATTGKRESHLLTETERGKAKILDAMGMNRPEPAEPKPEGVFQPPPKKNPGPDPQVISRDLPPDPLQNQPKAERVMDVPEPDKPRPPQPMFSQVEAGMRHAYIVRPRSVTVRIVPEELGELKIQISFENEKIHAKIQADSQRVVGILEEHQAELHHRMREQGMPLEKLEISQDSSRQNQDPDSQRESRAFGNGFEESGSHQRQSSGRGNGSGSGQGAGSESGTVTSARVEPVGVDENGHISITI